MAAAIQITGLQAKVDAEAVVARRLQLRIDGGTLRLSREALAQLIPPDVPAKVEGINTARVQLRVTWKGLAAVADILPEATPEGRLRLKVTGLRAGFLPLPPDPVVGLFLPFIPQVPGLTVVGGKMLDIDAAALLAPAGIQLGPLRRVGVDPGWIELHF